MNNFLLTVGWWNFGGSLVMLCTLNEAFGKKLYNEWTKIFKTEFKVDYWSKFWLFWAAGINVFFGLVNIMAVKWGYPEIKEFLIYTDIASYSAFLLLAVWGHIAGRCGSGIYSVYMIFTFWITWAVMSLQSD